MAIEKERSEKEKLINLEDFFKQDKVAEETKIYQKNITEQIKSQNVSDVQFVKQALLLENLGIDKRKSTIGGPIQKKPTGL